MSAVYNYIHVDAVVGMYMTRAIICGFMYSVCVEKDLQQVTSKLQEKNQQRYVLSMNGMEVNAMDNSRDIVRLPALFSPARAANL